LQEALCESGSGGRSWVPLSTLPPDFRAVAKAAPDASDYGDLNVAPGTDSYSVTYNNRRNSCHVDAFLEAAYIVENTAPGWLLTRVRPQLQDAFTAAISAQSKAHARDKDSIRHLNETRDTFLEQLSVHTGTPVGEQGTFDRNWENTFISPKDIAIKSTRSCTTEGCLSVPVGKAKRVTADSLVLCVLPDIVFEYTDSGTIPGPVCVWSLVSAMLCGIVGIKTASSGPACGDCGQEQRRVLYDVDKLPMVFLAVAPQPRRLYVGPKQHGYKDVDDVPDLLPEQWGELPCRDTVMRYRLVAVAMHSGRIGLGGHWWVCTRTGDTWSTAENLTGRSEVTSWERVANDKHASVYVYVRE
jgi:hypothetical protein